VAQQFDLLAVKPPNKQLEIIRVNIFEYVSSGLSFDEWAVERGLTAQRVSIVFRVISSRDRELVRFQQFQAAGSLENKVE